MDLGGVGIAALFADAKERHQRDALETGGEELKEKTELSARAEISLSSVGDTQAQQRLMYCAWGDKEITNARQCEPE